MSRLFVYAILLGCAVLGALGQIGLKKGMDSFQFARPLSTVNLWLVAGLFCYGCAMLAYLSVLRLTSLWTAYTMIAFTYPMVMLFSYLILHEPITFWKVVGSLGIVASVGLVMAG